MIEPTAIGKLANICRGSLILLQGVYEGLAWQSWTGVFQHDGLFLVVVAQDHGFGGHFDDVGGGVAEPVLGVGHAGGFIIYTL